MRFKDVMQLVRYDRGYLHAEQEDRQGRTPRTREQLKNAIRQFRRASARRAYVIYLIDRGIVALDLAEAVLRETAEPHFIEKGLPRCYFDQSRPSLA